MSDTTMTSEAKRILLEKYLRETRSQHIVGAGTIPRHLPGSPAPLSIEQQQLWLLDQLIADLPVYTECATLHLPGTLNVGALEQSFNEIIRRHEAWRTSFPI